ETVDFQPALRECHHRDRGRYRGEETHGHRLSIPHDAQVRRISWVRGVGRPALALSGLLVPLPDADRPPFAHAQHRRCMQQTKSAASKAALFVWSRWREVT